MIEEEEEEEGREERRKKKKKKNLKLLTFYSVALVRERTTPTERQPLVGEVTANFWG
jgi:hypothetical protein